MWLKKQKQMSELRKESLYQLNNFREEFYITELIN